MKKIGLDIHGVISNNPDLFKELTNTWCQAGIEVHIITGSRISDSLKNQLREWGIQYTHLFSISDYHHGLGTPMQGYEKYQPLIDENLWNRTKGEYCQKMGIDLHIDDTEIYGDYFTTPFMLYDSEDNKEHVFSDREIIDVFRGYFDKKDKWIVGWDMEYQPSEDIKIAGTHTIKIRTIPVTETMREENNKQLKQGAKELAKLLQQIQNFKIKEDKGNRLDELAKIHLGSLIKKDFVDPDPDDGGQMRYEMERFRSGNDMTPSNFRVSFDDNQSCMKCVFVRRIQGSLVCTAYYDFKIPHKFHVCNKLTGLTSHAHKDRAND